MFKNWRLLVIKWIFLVLFGILALTLPQLSLLVLLRYLAVMFIILWWFLLLWSFEHIHSNKHRFLWSIEWTLDILIGVSIVINPAISLQLLILLIAIRAIVKAIMHIIHAIHIKKHIILFIFNALVLFLFAYLLVFHPREWAVAMTYILGIFAIIFGIALIYLGSQLKYLWQNKWATTEKTPSKNKDKDKLTTTKSRQKKKGSNPHYKSKSQSPSKVKTHNKKKK